MIRLAIDTKLDQAQLNSLQSLNKLMWNGIILCNDYYSWAKEYAKYELEGKTGSLSNAVDVVMKLHDVDQAAAKDRVKAEIMQLESRYCEEKGHFIAREKPSSGVLRYLDSLELVFAGNIAWSRTTPRYRVPMGSVIAG